MPNLLKIIRSRYFISAAIILLELIQLIIVFILLYNNFFLMVLMAYITYIGVFIYIINHYESPEFKLPWIILLMLFPVISAFVFIVVIGSDENKKISKRHLEIKKNIRENLPLNDCLEELKNSNMDAYLQAEFLAQTNNFSCFKNTLVTYYPDGSSFHHELLKELNKAQNFIFMEYFIIEEGLMWDPIVQILKEKSKNGVLVYLIYDDFGCMRTLNEKYYQILNAEGINCIPSNKFKPILSKIHNNRDHRKITVIDGKIGFTGGINLADEYINQKVKYGYWKDTAVKLEGEGVINLTALFLESWNTQNKTELHISKFLPADYPQIDEQGYVFPYGDGPEDFYSGFVGKYVYLNIINSAKKYVYITTPYLICDYEILNALGIAAKKGIDVRILTPHIPDKKTIFLMTRSNYEVLIKNGVKIYEYTPGFIHAKNFICDDLYATVGTINLDYRSLVHHFECGVWMYNTKCLESMKEDFLEALKVSEEITLNASKLRGYQKLIAEIMKVFSPLL